MQKTVCCSAQELTVGVDLIHTVVAAAVVSASAVAVFVAAVAVFAVVAAVFVVVDTAAVVVEK